MMALFERFSGYFMFLAVFAVAYHFTDSFILVAIISAVFYFGTSMLGMGGVIIQALTWIIGAVFVITDGYPLVAIIIYYVLFILYIVRMIKILHAAKRGQF